MKIGKVELGQGTVTATMQLVADELDVPMSKVTFVQADTWVTPDQGYDGGEPVDRHPDRQCRHPSGRCRGPAGAAEHGVGEARRAGRKPHRLERCRQRGRCSVSYADLIGGKLFNLPQTGKAIPKPFTAYKIVGTSVPRVDVPEKVFGKFTYTQDVQLPGMLHARVVRPPTLDSTLVKVDGFPNGRAPDVVQVVSKNNFVAVVAKTEWGAIIGAQQLKVTWKTVPLPSWATFYDDLLTTGPSTDQVIQTRRSRRPERRYGARRDAGQEPGVRDLQVPDPDARLDGRLRVDRGCPGEHRHRLVVDAGRSTRCARCSRPH